MNFDLTTKKPVKKYQYGIALFAVSTLIVWNIPGGHLILYPFTLLGTWFHELAHGLMAILLGGDFHKLVIQDDGSGYAQFSYSSLLFGNFGKSIVAAAGPVGPSLAGAIFVVSSAKIKSTKIMLFVLSFLLIISSILWVRPVISIGFLVILIFSAVISFIAYKSSDNTKVLTLQFLAVQAFISVYMSIDYLFTSGAVVGGQEMLSDTGVISQNLFLPHWIWGGLILILNIYLLYISFKYYFKKNK